MGETAKKIIQLNISELLNVLNEVCIFPFLFSRFGVIFNIITLNSLSGSLPIFSLCIWSCGFYLVPLSAR